MLPIYPKIPIEQKHFLYLFAFFISLISAFAQSDSAIELEKISEYVEQIKESYNLPGVTVSITDKDSTLYLEHFGNIGANDQVLIGSCSKSFTALLTLKLEQKGLLNLNDPVHKYLNWFQYADKNQSDRIVVRDLLQHTSGIPSIFGRLNIEEDENKSTKNSIQYKLSTISLESDETHYEYSNFNYDLLGYIIEQVTARTYGDALHDEILMSLKLKNTSGFVLNPNKQNFPQSFNYFLYYPIIPFTSTYYKDEIPSGYIASTAGDMAIYLRELLKSYVDDSSLLFEKDIVDSLFTPNDTVKSNYGYGWFKNNWQNREIVRHSGLTEGFNTSMIVLPSEGKAIFVGINSSTGSAFEIAAGIFHLLIDKEPRKFSKIVFYLIRSIPLLVLVLMLVLFVQIKKWRDKNYRIRLCNKLKPNLLLGLGIMFGLLWVIVFPILYNTSMEVIIEYDPVSGISLIIIATSSILISFLYYLNNQPNDLLL